MRKPKGEPANGLQFYELLCEDDRRPVLRASSTFARTPGAEQRREIGEADLAVAVQILRTRRRAYAPRAQQLRQVGEAHGAIAIEIGRATVGWDGSDVDAKYLAADAEGQDGAFIRVTSPVMNGRAQ